MKSNSFLKALFILLGLIFAIVGAVYWLDPAPRSFKFSTTYSVNVKPAPPEDPNTVIEVPGVIRSFDITNDGSRIAIVTSKAVVVYDLKTREEIYNLPVSEKVIKTRFSPDGSKLAVSGITVKYFESGPLHVTVWDTHL